MKPVCEGCDAELHAQNKGIHHLGISVINNTLTLDDDELVKHGLCRHPIYPHYIPYPGLPGISSQNYNVSLNVTHS